MPKLVLVSILTTLVVTGLSGGADAALVVSKAATTNVDCSGGICNATAPDAVLNVKDLTNMLAASDVHVFAEGAATDITVSSPFSWASSHKLTLGAYGSLNVKAAITVQGTSGLTIATNVAQTGGIFRLVGIGKISFWDTSSTLIINNATYTLINNLPDLVAAIAAHPAGTYAFANDYNAALDGSYPHAPIPTTFTGVFEGLGNAIDKLTIFNANSLNDEPVALFSQLGSGGQLSDVVLTNVSMQTQGAYIAALAAVNHGTIDHSSATGSISGANGGANWFSAGLVYDNEGTITRAHAGVTLTDNALGAGGLVYLNDGTISLSDASGSVSSSQFSGGLVALSSGAITDSFAQGPVIATLDHNGVAGGLVANSSGPIQRCFATGIVEGAVSAPGKKSLSATQDARFRAPGNHLGGLVGVSSGPIADAYATGSVTQASAGQARFSKNATVGGLVGYNAGTIQQTYALGLVSLSHKKYPGGVIGFDAAVSGSNVASFWDLDTTGIDNPNQGAGNVFDDKGLRGVGDKQFRRGTVIHNFDPNVWAQDPEINNNYPYLISNPPPQ